MKPNFILIGAFYGLCVGAHLRTAAAVTSLSIQELANGQVQNRLALGCGELQLGANRHSHRSRAMARRRWNRH